MKKNRFKLGVLFLLGLVGYFLALSAILVASAGLPEGSNAKTSGTSDSRKDTPKKAAGKAGLDGNSSDHQSGFPDPGLAWTEGGPCLSPQSSCGTLNSPSANGLNGGSWGSGNGSSRPGGKGGFFSGQDFSHPASYGAPIYGNGGPAFGPHADFGENGSPFLGGSGSGSSGDRDRDGGGDGDPSGKYNPPFGSSGPDLDSPFPQLDPPLFTTNDTPDPESPPVETAATTPVPEPSTFWVIIASLMALAMAPRSLGRAPRTRFNLRDR